MEQTQNTRSFPSYIPYLGLVLNIPALLIWLTLYLYQNQHPLGVSMAGWMRVNFSGMEVIFLWLMFPSAALIFGLGSYAFGGSKIPSVAVIVLSSLLLLSIILGALQLVR